MQAHVATRQSLESSTFKIMKIASQAKDIIQDSLKFFTNFPVLQAMKILDAKAAVDKDWTKLETIPAWKLDKSSVREGQSLEKWWTNFLRRRKRK